MLNPDTDFGQVLIQLRTDLGISQSEAARRAGVDQGMWSRIELGKSTQLPLVTYLKVLKGVDHALTVSRATEQS